MAAADKDAADSSVPSPTPSGDFQELRALLLKPEHAELESLKQMLASRPPVEARSIAALLPDAVTIAESAGPSFEQAMGKTVEQALQTSVRRRPEVITEAIFPIIGGAITRAVRESLVRLLQQTSYALDHAFSLRGWKWRIEALATGKSFSEVVLLHSLIYRVEQVFLIHPESGLLLQHIIAPSVAESLGDSAENAAMVTSMLTAIQDFVRDSFRVESKASLDSVEVGDLKVWLERGPHAVLACVIRGSAPMSLRDQLRDTVEICHRNYLEVLTSYSGDTDDLKGVRPHLEACLQEQLQPEESRSWLTWLVLLSLLGTGGYFLRAKLVRERLLATRLSHAMESLHHQPGVVLLDAAQHNGHFQLRLLRDPEAESEAVILHKAGLRAEETAAEFAPYLSLESELVLRRAHHALLPPDGVTLSYNITDGVLSAQGIASQEWIEQTKLLTRAIPGMRSFVCQVSALPRPKSLYAVLYERARVIESIEFRFRAGSIELLPGQESQLQRAVAEMKELLRMAEDDKSGLNITIEVHAHTDTIGSELYNLKLRENRAKVMSHWLANSGVDMRRLRPVAPLQFEQERIDRAASFRVVITAGLNGIQGSR